MKLEITGLDSELLKQDEATIIMVLSLALARCKNTYDKKFYFTKIDFGQMSEGHDEDGPVLPFLAQISGTFKDIKLLRKVKGNLYLSLMAQLNDSPLSGRVVIFERLYS